MRHLNRIEVGDVLFDVIVPRFNAVVDAVNALGEIHGDNITIVVDEALGYCIRMLDTPTPPGAAGEGGDTGVGVITAGPSGGSGAATWQPVADDLTPEGSTVPVVVLPLR